jgi:hypothetical protein
MQTYSRPNQKLEGNHLQLVHHPISNFQLLSNIQLPISNFFMVEERSVLG